MRGKVISESERDTFTLLNSTYFQYKIRLYGIDCPEYKQDFGQVDRKFADKLNYSKQVYIKEIGRDKYNRILSIVYT